MLELPDFKIDGKPKAFYPNVRSTEDLPVTLQFWMGHLARDLLQLGVYFQAAAIMGQVPGADRYRLILYDDLDDDAPDCDDNPDTWVGNADCDTVFNVLAECLRRLGAEHLIEQVPGARDYERQELSAEWNEYLDRNAKFEHALLNVVAQCLDDLIVTPGMAEIDDKPQATWWQKWWAAL